MPTSTLLGDHGNVRSSKKPKFVAKCGLHHTWERTWPIDHSRKYHNIPWCSLFVTPIFSISIVFSFSWELTWPERNWKQCFCKISGRQTKRKTKIYDMLWYILEWSIGNGSHVHHVHVQRFQDSNERKDIKHSTCLG